MKTNELKCTDLRIGNLLKYDDEIVMVYELYDDAISILEDSYVKVYHIDNFDPIKLTEELLLKIGFEKDGNNYSLVCGDIEVGYYIDKFKQVLYINVCRKKRFHKNELRSYDVKYLHQLQNAYHLLTGKELEVSL